MVVKFRYVYVILILYLVSMNLGLTSDLGNARS